MDISKFLIKDPEHNGPSVSLTMMLISFVLVLVCAGLDMAGKVKSTSIILEVFWGTCGLYFGRKFTNKSGSNIDTTKEGQ